MNKSILSFLLFAVLQSGCSLDSFVKANDPENETELTRSYIRSHQGAMSLFHAARGSLQEVVSLTSMNVGLLTDELSSVPLNHRNYRDGNVMLDARYKSTSFSTTGLHIDGINFPAYEQTHAARISANHARVLFKELDDPLLIYAISATYSIEAYAIMIMAENMCSGIPLSDVPLEGEATYGHSLSTDEVFRIAVAKFDSALQLQHDSSRYTTLAKIGKGRALIGLAEYEKAAEAVKNILPEDKFDLRYTEINNPGVRLPAGAPYDAFWTWVPASASTTSNVTSTEIVNREGQNGLVWYSDPMNMDPRIPVTTEIVGGVIRFPASVKQKKFVKGDVTFQLARWIEAKLIESEYRLSVDDENWIDPLNEARRSIGLPDTTSPSLTDDRVNLLFRERAYWFYGEAVRLADFRRLVRQYRRSPFKVYPTGPYTKSRGSIQHYGNAFVYVPPASEYNLNHRYSGCFDENP